MTLVESFKNGLWIHSPAPLGIAAPPLPDVNFYRVAPGRYAFSSQTATYLAANRGLEVGVGAAPVDFAPVAGAGLTVTMRTQSAFAGAGGDLILLTGNGAAGRRGSFNATGAGAGLRTTMIGTAAGGLSTGDDCTFLGASAGRDAVGALRCTFLGSSAGLTATGDDNTALGYNASIAAGLTTSIAVGSGAACAGGSLNIVVGYNSTATGASNVLIGPNAIVTGTGTVAIGASTNVAASNSTAVGVSTSAGAGSIALGYGASAGVAVAVMGSNGFPIGILYGGKGETNAAATAWAVSGTGGTTAGGGNSPGAALELRGGPGTGTGAGGSVQIRTAPYGVAGIAVNAFGTRLDFNQYGLAAHTPAAALTLAADVPAAVPPEWALTAAAHGAAPGPGILAATERMDVYYNLSRTVRYASGNIALQRAFRITAPTYNIIAGVSQTIATAATFYVDDAPQAAGGGTAITQSYGVYQAAGNAYFGGALNLNSNAAAVSPVGEGRIRYNNGTSAFEVSISGAAYVALATGAGSVPGAPVNSFQWNSAGAFAGQNDLTYDLVTTTLAICTGVHLKSGAAPANFAAAAPGAGTTVYVKTQDGNTAGAGGNLIVQTGSPAGANRRGYVNFTGRGAGLRTTYIGEDAGTNCTGDDNAFYGYRAGYAAVTRVNCCAYGSGAMENNVSGNNCSAFGQGSLTANMSHSNTAFGQACLANTTGAERESGKVQVAAVLLAQAPDAILAIMYSLPWPLLAIWLQLAQMALLPRAASGSDTLSM
jgi:hypothetical protein